MNADSASISEGGEMRLHDDVEKGLDHVMVHFVRDTAGSPVGFIAIHRGTKEHPAFGATRVYHYAQLSEARDDALRLGRLMSYKNAFASSRYGGGKGVLMMSEEDQRNPKRRSDLLFTYATEVNKLGGAFVTGADVGMSLDDVRLLKKHSPYIVGLSRDPVLHTAQGVLAALRAALRVRFGNTDLSSYSYGILGAGKVGGELIDFLYQQGAPITASDINPDIMRHLAKKYPEVTLVTPEELLTTPMDVFMPCAMGGVLNAESIAQLQAQIIVGAANNQLSDISIGDELHKKQILYVPDYVANGGGVMSVINEYEGSSDESLFHQVREIENIVQSILEKSKHDDIAPHRIADNIAREKIDVLFQSRKILN